MQGPDLGIIRVGALFCIQIVSSPFFFPAALFSYISRSACFTALSASVSASDLKLVSAVIVAAAISAPAILDAVRLNRMRKEESRHADA